MRQYQKRKKLHMLIAILMSLNIFSVGYATWAITGPSTDTTDGGFVSYPVIKSDDYYTLTTAMDFQGYFNNEEKTQGYFVLTDGNGNLREEATEEQAKTGTITLTYTKKEALTNPEITTTIVFGDTTASAAFFETAAPSWSISGGDFVKDASKLENGILTLVFTPSATKTTITITLGTAGRSFPEGLKSGTYQFKFNTTVQGTPAN